MTTPYVDGYFGTEEELSVLPDVRFPFANEVVPDVYARISQRKYQVTPSKSFPNAPRTANRTSWSNLVLYSEQFDNAAWLKTNVTVVADQIANPYDGQVTADKLTVPATAATFFEQGVVATSTSHAFFICVKKGDTNGDFNNFTFFNTTNSATLVGGKLDLNSGQFIKTAGAGTGRVVTLGGGWFMLILEASAGIAIGNTIKGYIGAAGETITVGRFIYVWGAQINEGTAGPYILTTSATRTVSAPDRDVTINSACNMADPFAFCVEEDDPVYPTSSAGEVVRRFIRIPKPQTSYSSQTLTKPLVSAYGVSLGQIADYRLGNATGNLGLGYSYNSKAWSPTNEFYTRNSVAIVVTAPSGGTFTVTYKTSTTAALNWNDSGATIAAAINALAAVIADGLTVTVNAAISSTNIQITCTAGATTSRFTANGGSLTPAAASTIFGTWTSSTVQLLTVAGRGTIIAHGFTSSGNLLSSEGTTQGRLLEYTYNWLVIDANTVAILGGASVTYVGQFYRSYTPGLDRARIKIVTSFYLVGMSFGIATEEDIPIPDPAIADPVFLTLITTQTSGYAQYDAGTLAPWRGAIQQLPINYLNLADV